jgi:hypothetical protein
MNGWTTFETWKIWHEVFSHWEPQEVMDAKDVLAYVEEALELGSDNSLKDNIVYSWLLNVNWTEIADALNEQWVQAQKDAE